MSISCGCTITPKKAQYLTVPVHPNAVGKRARDFDDLFFYEAKSGEKFLMRDKGQGGIEPYFWLTKSVKIPPRSFLRAGHDKEAKAVMDKAAKAVCQVIHGNMSTEQFYDKIGQMLATKIKTYARNLKEPPNSWSTKEAKGSSNPLDDTGGMIEGISWRVKGG